MGGPLHTMNQARAKIDRSLPERRRLCVLLDRVQDGQVSPEELEDIGSRLGSARERALPLVLRRLERERDGAVVARYVSLLEQFDPEGWLSRVVNLVLRRREMEPSGLAALLELIDSCGIDIDQPVFRRVLDRIGNQEHRNLPLILEQGDQGFVQILDDFLFSPPESRRQFIRSLAAGTDSRLVPLLRVLLEIDDGETPAEAIAVLGRVRSTEAAKVLAECERESEESLRILAQRSRRRLSFLGYEAEPEPLPPSLPFHSGFAGPVDGEGYRTVWLARGQENGRIIALCAELHESRGMTSAWGSGNLTEEEYDLRRNELCSIDQLVTVRPEYVLRLLRDGIYRSRLVGMPLPAEFYLRYDLLRPAERRPNRYEPNAGATAPLYPVDGSRFPGTGDGIMDDDFCAGWFLHSPRVFDYADELDLLETTGGNGKSRRIEGLLERFCRELLLPQVDTFRRRLLVTADLMRETGRDGQEVARFVAVAASLHAGEPRPHHHPFLRQYALESLDMAREALSEGYDPRSADLEWRGE